jgi:hypothetical protein
MVLGHVLSLSMIRNATNPDIFSFQNYNLANWADVVTSVLTFFSSSTL